MQESQIIALAKHYCPPPLKGYGIGDDCAITPNSDSFLLSSVDTLLENVHFFPNMPPEDLGWKTLAVNLSDIAAMAGTPRHFLLSLALPHTVSENWLHSFFKGLSICAKEYDVHLIGGDTVRSQEMALSLTILGESSNPILRSQAQVGDLIWTTGPLGLSAGGFYCIKNKITGFPRLIRQHYHPLPQIEAGKKLSGLANALIDSSDGLGVSLAEISKQSGVGCQVNLEKVPTSKDLLELCKKEEIPLSDFIIYGGEDYQLIFCAPPNLMFPFANCIGEVIATPQISFYNKTEVFEFIEKKAFSHF